MTTQPDHHSSELVPRPERTPDALRVAVAKIAPHRLREMEKQKNEASQIGLGFLDDPGVFGSSGR
jgi:hypothetical protein